MNALLIATYRARYATQPEEVLLRVPEHDVAMAKLGFVHAQNSVCKNFQEAYAVKFGRKPGFIIWDNLQLEETDESTQQPRSCGCSCTACSQGNHCSNNQFHCYLKN